MTERFDTFSPPSGAADPWETATPTEPEPDDDRTLEPHEAAALLERTTRQAEREFDLGPPILTLAAAVTVVVAYGAIWFSVRDQHPYSGPSGTALAVLYGTLAVWIAVVGTFMRHTLSGRSSRLRRLEGITFALIWICVYVFQGALFHVDPSHTIAYGVYPAVAPLIIVGAVSAGYETARENRGRAGFAVAAVVLGASAAFAGPSDVWGVVGLGLSSLLVIAAAGQLWRRRARV